MNAALRFARYGSVALLAAGGDWLLFVLLASVVGIAPLASLMAARFAGGLLSFLSNRYWTWGANRRIAVTRQGRRFLLLYAFSYALSVALFRLSTEVLLLPPYPSKLAVDLCCFVINYVAMNSYVFHARDGLARFLVRASAAPDGVPGLLADRADGVEATEKDFNAP
jgi:putative flippase GtrA